MTQARNERGTGREAREKEERRSNKEEDHTDKSSNDCALNLEKKNYRERNGFGCCTCNDHVQILHLLQRLVSYASLDKFSVSVLVLLSLLLLCFDLNFFAEFALNFVV